MDMVGALEWTSVKEQQNCQQRSSLLPTPILENHIRPRFFPESTEPGVLGFGKADCTSEEP